VKGPASAVNNNFTSFDGVTGKIIKDSGYSVGSFLTPATVGDYTHEHGIMRWDGAIGQTTFDLPDYSDFLDSVSIGGIDEDPLVYSLSAYGDQVILDNALVTATTVIARYQLRTL
jgi:hypothetical protein